MHRSSRTRTRTSSRIGISPSEPICATVATSSREGARRPGRRAPAPASRSGRATPETARRLSNEDPAVRAEPARGRGDGLDGSRGQRPLPEESPLHGRWPMRQDDGLSGVTGEPPRLTMAAARPGALPPATVRATRRRRKCAPRRHIRDNHPRPLRGKRVHGYTSEDALAPGAIVEIGGRSWLVNRIAGEGVDAWPARHRLTLRHPDGRGARCLSPLSSRRAAPRPPADDARGRGADQLGRRRATARSR